MTADRPASLARPAYRASHPRRRGHVSITRLTLTGVIGTLGRRTRGLPVVTEHERTLDFRGAAVVATLEASRLDRAEPFLARPAQGGAAVRGSVSRRCRGRRLAWPGGR